MDFREFSAKTVDEAITKASIELQVPSADLEIQVIEEGSSGFLGFGSKPAKIRVSKKEIVESLLDDDSMLAADIKEEPVPKPEKPQNPDIKKNVLKAQEESGDEKIVQRSEEEIASIKDTASTFLKGVFEAMELDVRITMNYIQEQGDLDIEFAGEDMGILIGKRGQTLDSLQYLTSLVVNKGVPGYIRVKLDTENYRNRRKETLENLAKSIAYKVRKTRKPVSLEPMNPYERRIIHSALQGNKFVETTSEGNEPYRHVVVKAKR